MSESKHHDHDHDDHEDHGHHEHDHLIIKLLREIKETGEKTLAVSEEDLRLQKEDLQLQRDTIRLLIEIIKGLHQLTRPRTTQLGIRLGDTMDPATINIGQSIPATAVPLLTDGVTPSGGVVSDPQWSTSDASIASIATNPDGTATLTGVAEGSVTVSVTATVTDTNGAVSSFNGSNTLTVSPAPPPQPITASLGVQFGTPTP